MTVHDAFHKKKAAYRSASTFSVENPLRQVFAFWRRGKMTVHDAFHKKKAAYRSASTFSVENPLRRVFCFLAQRKDDCPRRFSQKESGLPVSFNIFSRKPASAGFLLSGAEER
ncbi:hypothetical protein ACMGGR_18880 [Erwinia sp. BNK-24-b]|uniref:hypothetical protein n=1 Tax=unclassified Erwinia TaxID=2622719 RepID=UPI0039BF5DEC